MFFLYSCRGRTKEKADISGYFVAEACILGNLRQMRISNRDASFNEAAVSKPDIVADNNIPFDRQV